MEKKVAKFFSFSILGLMLLSFCASFVLAADADDAAEATKGALEGTGRYVSAVFGPFFGDKEILTRVFFAILLGMIIYMIIGQILGSERNSVKWIVTIIITALSLMWMPVNFIAAIRDTYGAMGAGILAAIPFMIILVFSMRVGSALVARITWIFFMFYYFAIYLYRIFTTEVGWWSAESIPYMAAVGAGLVIFLLIGAIRRAWFHGEMKGVQEAGQKVASRAQLLHQLQGEELEKSYLKGNEKAGNV